MFEIGELNPTVFKSTAIEIMRSSNKRPNELQAVKLAHDTYTKKGATATELEKLFKNYH